MITLPHLFILRFKGADAANFLHNQLSADILGLNENDSTFGCYCEPRGRVLALMLITRMGDDYLAVLSSSLAASVEARMKIYVMRSKVEIDILKDVTVLGLDSPLADPQMHIFSVPGTELQFALANTDTAPSVDTGKVSQWKLHELKQGICWLDDHTSGQFLPQMLGYDALGAINFKKGCYPGQEIVARTHYLGKVKRHPRILEVRAAPTLGPMDTIHLQSDSKSDKAVVIDSAGTSEDGYGIFVVSRIDPDTGVSIVDGGNS